MSIADTQFNDDQYNYDPSAQKPSQPSDPLLMPGVYEFSVDSAAETVNRQTGEKIVSRDDFGNEWPSYTIQRVSVQQPSTVEGSFAVFHEIRTRPYRTSKNDESSPYRSDAAVVLRSLDAEAADSAEGFGDATKLLAEKLSQFGLTFKASTGLEGTDTEWAKAQIAKLGPNASYAEKRAIWDKAKLKTRAFKLPNGRYASQAKGLSGKMIKARVVLKTFIPSNVECELGEGQFPPKID